MRRKDTMSKKYLEVPEHFADAFNYYLYDGKQVIKPGDLEEKDPEEMLYLVGPKKDKTLQRYRDILRSCSIRWCRNGLYILLGIENQSELHYAMPVRNLLNDALNYTDQVRKAGEQHRKNKDRMNSGEYMSDFTKEDRLIPVITLVIYWGDREWDAPRRLSDMYADTDPEISKYLMDYEINLITPHDISDFGKFATELGDVLEVIKRNNEGIPISAMLQEKGEDWTMSRLGVEVINEFTKADLSIEAEEGDEVKMGRAFQLLVEQGIEQGIDRHAVELICKKIAKGKGIATIADEIEESEEYVARICDIAAEFAPEYDVDKILEKLWENKKSSMTAVSA